MYFMDHSKWNGEQQQQKQSGKKSKEVVKRWEWGKVGVQSRPHSCGFEWNPEGSEGVNHMWILRGRGCSQREQKWQRSHGKTVLGMLNDR